MRDTTMLPQLFAEHMGRISKGLGVIAIAHGEFCDEIMRLGAMRARRIRSECGLTIIHHRQRLIINHDQRCGVFGDVATISNHHRNGFTHMHDLFVGQGGAMQLLAESGAWQRHFQQRIIQVMDDIFHAPDRAHARHVDCSGNINAANECVSLRAAHKGCMQHAGEVDVIDKASLTAQQSPIFNAFDAGTDDAGHAPLPACFIRCAASSAAATMPS